MLAAERGIDVITHEQNRGYGAALKTAFDAAISAAYDVLVTIDCDGQHEPHLIPELAAEIFDADGSVWDIVSGSRYLQVFEGDSLPPVERRQINVTITERLNQELGLSLTDAFCGFKAYRVASLERLNVTDPGYAMPLELWVMAAAQKMRIKEFAVPLIYLEEERSFGGSLDDARRRMAYYSDVLERAQAAYGSPGGDAQASGPSTCAGPSGS